MTCFSIQNFSFSAAIACFLLAFAPLSVSAQTDAGTPETVEGQEEELAKSIGPIVLELFTTTDCSACALADRMLYDTMLKDKDIIALSCKVTDLSDATVEGIADPRTVIKKQSGPMDPCILRQWAFRAGRTDTNVTIPAFIFNGQELVRMHDMNYFMKILKAYHYKSRNKSLQAFLSWKDQDTITVHLPEDPNIEKNPRSASVWIVRYKDIVVEKVEEGINKGRVLRFSNVIQDTKHIGKWHGHMRSMDIDVPPPQGGKERGGYVILVQELMGSPVLAAGKLEDYPHPNDKKKAPPVNAAPKQ